MIERGLVGTGRWTVRSSERRFAARRVQRPRPTRATGIFYVLSNKWVPLISRRNQIIRDMKERSTIAVYKVEIPHRQPFSLAMRSACAKYGRRSRPPVFVRFD